LVQLIDSDIKTREVLDWKGVHVLHHPLSSCSQKLRIFLNLKKVAWESHVIDIMHNENLGEWYLGVNPRGLLPSLVHDGAVHIESNDILVYLDKAFPDPALIPAGGEDRMAALLKHEDDLHLDLRALSFRFVFAPPEPPKSAEDLQRYAVTGSGTVLGQKDPAIGQQIIFWEKYAATGITDDAARQSAEKFRTAFDDLDRRLEDSPYLVGEALSVLDIAWFIYANRLIHAGYPVARLHAKVGDWYAKLLARPEFSKEIELPPPLAEQFAATRAKHVEAGQTLELVAGL